MVIKKLFWLTLSFYNKNNYLVSLFGVIIINILKKYPTPNPKI